MFRRIAILLLTAFLFGGLVEAAFWVKSPHAFDFGQERFWIHHGGEPANSIEGVQALLARGERFIELDAFYFQGEMYLSHDQHESITGQPTLRQVLALMGEEDYRLWLDLKNLTFSNASEIADYYHQALSTKTFIESQNRLGGIWLSGMGVPVSLWILPQPQSLSGVVRNSLDRLTWVLGKFISVSFDQQSYGLPALESYQHIPKLVFTYPTPQEAQSLAADASVKVVLVKKKSQP